jgi:hypothetical protein
MNAQWLLQCSQNTYLLPQTRLAAVSLWGRAELSGVVCASLATQTMLSRSCSLELETWQHALADAVDAGWLAPLEWGPSGELRTSLRMPEGV